MTDVARAALPVEGAMIGGKYRVARVIGEGGMGLVFEASHVRLGQRVAIKMLHPHMLAQPELLARFEREARAAGQLRSPHAVRIIDVDATAEGLPFMVMEFLDGRDLAAELKARGHLSVDEAVDCLLQVCEAMAEAHALGIVHRDLKPSNLYLAREGQRTVVKVLDFGISKMAAGELDVHVTSTLATMGTPLYMSPEQIRSAKNVDARSDVWSLGVILFELLTGRVPFLGSAMAVSAAIVADSPPRPRELRPDLPEAIEPIVLKALAKAPEARWPDVKSMAEALAPLAGARLSLAQGMSVPRGPQASSPSMVSGPTLAATPSVAGVSPLAHTEAAPGATPPVTSGTWSKHEAPAPARRSRGLVIALVAASVAAVALVGAGYLRRSPPATSVSTTTVVAPPPASMAATADPTVPSPSSAPSATVAPGGEPSTAPADSLAPAHGKATAGPRSAVAPPPPTPPSARPTPTATTTPPAPSNPIRL